MNAKPPLPSARLAGVALLLATVAGLSAWIGVQHRRIDSLVERNARLRAELEISRQHALKVDAQLAALRARPAAVEPASAASALPADGSVPDAHRAQTEADLPAGLLDHPALQPLVAAATKGSLDARYGLLFRKLELDPGRQDRLKELLTERQMTTFDLLRAAQAQGLGTAETEALLAASGAEIDANIRLLLGQPGYERFQDYQKNLGAYGVLADLERRLGPNNAPLSEAQSEALLRVLTENSSMATPGIPPEDPLSQVLRSLDAAPAAMNAPSRRALLSDQILSALEPLLNESQLEALRELQAEQ